jgi:hypothetical protein
MTKWGGLCVHDSRTLHYGEASDSIDDLPDWVAEATAGTWADHGFAGGDERSSRPVYRHQWAMSHCREKAERALAAQHSTRAL